MTDIQAFHAAIHMQESLPQKQSLVGCTSPSMRLAQHLTALRAWCRQSLPGRKKTDILHPGIWDARVLWSDRGHAWHEYTPPPLLMAVQRRKKQFKKLSPRTPSCHTLTSPCEHRTRTLTARNVHSSNRSDRPHSMIS